MERAAMMIELEKVRIDLKRRAPVAASAMLFSARDALKTEPRKIAEDCLTKGISVSETVETIYVRMTGIRLPVAA